MRELEIELPRPATVTLAAALLGRPSRLPCLPVTVPVAVAAALAGAQPVAEAVALPVGLRVALPVGLPVGLPVCHGTHPVAVTSAHGPRHPLYLRPEILILVLFFIERLDSSRRYVARHGQ